MLCRSLPVVCHTRKIIYVLVSIFNCDRFNMQVSVMEKILYIWQYVFYIVCMHCERSIMSSARI